MPNPLLDLTDLPRFSAIRPEHVEPAIDTTLKENRALLRDLLDEDGAARWDSLVEPLEAMGHRLSRIWAPIGHLNAVLNSEPLREAYNRCLPKLSEYATELHQNEALCRAYETISTGQNGLDPAQRKVLEHALRDFRLSGVSLAGADKDRFRLLMHELATLQARFEENLLDASNAWHCRIHSEQALEGLPVGVKARAREAAAERGDEGWLLALDFPSYHAVLSHANDTDLRQQFYEAWTTRASDQGPHAGRWDNTTVIESILAHRHEAATLLGFANFAEYSLASKMAGEPSQVIAFIEDLAARSRPAAAAEYAEIETFAGRPLAPWDVAYFAERLRRERHSITDEMLRPYFPVHRVLSGMFELVGQLFGIEIHELAAPDAWHPGVQYFEVRDQNGPRGGFYVDLYARTHKRGGAWMDDCVGRARVDGHLERPVAFLVCNFMPAAADRPALLSHDEVVTLFHEFGHTLHHLLTRVDYPSVAGINGVAWDAVELPSQFMENFAWRAEVLPMISAHHQTGEPLPSALLDRLLGSRNFQAGMHMVRQLEFALFDFRIHSAPEALNATQVGAALDEVRRQVAVVPYPDSNRFAHGFSHVFGGGYAAGYYSYKWAEVLSADAFSAFEDAGIVDPETGERFLHEVLEVGGSIDAMDAFIAFRGRRPEPDALMRLCGIAGDP